MKTCKRCGSPIGFKRLASGKWCPTNPDGSDHFDVCRLTEFVNAKREVKVGMLTTKTVPDIPQKEFLKIMNQWDQTIPPWDESIKSDWSWARGYKTIRCKDAYEKFVDPRQLLASKQGEA